MIYKIRQHADFMARYKQQLQRTIIMWHPKKHPAVSTFVSLPFITTPLVFCVATAWLLYVSECDLRLICNRILEVDFADQRSLKQGIGNLKITHLLRETRGTLISCTSLLDTMVFTAFHTN